MVGAMRTSDDDGMSASPTRRAALRLLGLGALGSIAPLAGLAAWLDSAAAEAQDGSDRAALVARFEDGHLAADSRLVHGAAGARVVGLVDAEFRRTIGTLLAFDAYSVTFAPWLRDVRVLSRSHGHARLYATIELARSVAPTWVELDVVIRGAADGTHRVEMNRVRGELQKFYAAWQLVATPGRVRTLASFELAFVPPLALPAGTVRSANLDAARVAFAGVRRAARARHGRRT